MKLDIHQPPLNTSLMGVVKGIADYFRIPLSVPSLFGRTGHAFLINIHRDICPSSPYVWNMEHFISLLENSGIAMKDHGFFSVESSAVSRDELEEVLRREIDSGLPCSVVNLDHQIISGYDETGFICIQPWECDFPPPHLTFGSWKEWGDELHACFFSFRKVEPLDPTFSIQRSLLYALELGSSPEARSQGLYTCGHGAYDSWIEGVRNGHGGSHGNWWNGIVWSECRGMGAEYFREIAADFPGCSVTALELADQFKGISERLLEVSNKELETESKIRLLEESKSIELKALPLMEMLAETIET